jgi:hypothetical protein
LPTTLQSLGVSIFYLNQLQPYNQFMNWNMFLSFCRRTHMPAMYK